ncbi:MAG: prepilin-type N-terminal cleavage/methylation domain-containing protein [Deltaproteobacteria bacterium]|nr:prepilin-type N-terminal cleavage/methylation domain-containing protein [Deltaproteobacteria bacterium]
MRIKMLKSEKGFSMIEMLLVIAIIMIIAAIAATGSGSYQGRWLRAASQQLYGDLQKTRIDAMTKSIAANSRGWGIQFDSSSQYTIFEFNDTNGNFDYDSGEAANARQVTLQTGITVTKQASGDPSGRTNVLMFSRQGLSKNYKWSSVGNRTYVLRYSGIADARCLVLDDVRIREGAWNGSECTKQ